MIFLFIFSTKKDIKKSPRRLQLLRLFSSPDSRRIDLVYSWTPEEKDHMAEWRLFPVFSRSILPQFLGDLNYLLRKTP